MNQTQVIGIALVAALLCFIGWQLSPYVIRDPKGVLILAGVFGFAGLMGIYFTAVSRFVPGHVIRGIWFGCGYLAVMGLALIVMIFNDGDPIRRTPTIRDLAGPGGSISESRYNSAVAENQVLNAVTILILGLGTIGPAVYPIFVGFQKGTTVKTPTDTKS